MQYTITISQNKALEWGLNAQQAMLFAFVYECPSWAKPINTDGGIFYALSKAKIVEELPLLTGKPDTAYRLLRQLETAGVIELSHTPSITLVRLTDKGLTWNRAVDGSEKYPSLVGKISEVGRKNIRAGSEKSPTNQETSQETSQEEHLVPAAAATPDAADKIPYEQIRELYNQILGGKLPRCLGLNDKHRKHIRAAYNLKLEGKYIVREGGMEFWEGLFNDVLDCEFLLGQNGRAWQADFAFLTTATKIQAFFEGKYDAR